ncbi:YitT family protein [Nonlabens sp.]|uniref:YitT family protein n=1 Tax=Nonlabens sp. TaxID=1888209 RepID=UPI003F699B0A
MKHKQKLINYIREYSQIAIGIFLASIGLKAFLLPNNFLDGGVTGIAILLSQQTGWDISILLIVLSVPFIIVGMFTVSKRIVIKSIIAIALLALSISLETFPIITDDKLLISIFGGMFLGAGIGVTIRNGAVLDGSELLGLFVLNKYGISIGKTIIAFNVILFSITAYVVSVEIAMYSILAYLVTAKVIDLFIQGLENFIGLTIVSQKSKEITDAIAYDLGVGMTIYKGASGYGSSGINKEINIIQTVVNRIDINKTLNLIETIDPKAFVIEFDVNKVRGGVLKRYLTKGSGAALPDSIVKSSSMEPMK